MEEQGGPSTFVLLAVFGCSELHCATLQHQLPALLLPGAASNSTCFRQAVLSAQAPLLTTFSAFLLLALWGDNRS